MSAIKEQAKVLKEKAKEFGYDIKHTHALELITQATQGVNRHVALSKEKETKSNLFSLENHEPAIQLPFGVSKHVIQFNNGEFSQYYITDSLGTMFEEMFDDSFSDLESFLFYGLESIKILSKQDLEEEIVLMNQDYDAIDKPKKLIDRIMEKAAETNLDSFSLFTDYSDS